MNNPAAVPLTDRLRSVPRDKRLIFSPPDMPPSAMSMSVAPVGTYMHEAADEIERLRAAVANLTAYNEGRDRMRADMTAEVDRLRDSVDHMRTTLGMASRQFASYAEQHRAKTPPDAAKAATNDRWARWCLQAAGVEGVYTGESPIMFDGIRAGEFLEAAKLDHLPVEVTPGRDTISFVWSNKKDKYIYLDIGPKDTIHLFYEITGEPKWEGVSIAGDPVIHSHMRRAFGLFYGWDAEALALTTTTDAQTRRDATDDAALREATGPRWTVEKDRLLDRLATLILGDLLENGRGADANTLRGIQEAAFGESK